MINEDVTPPLPFGDEEQYLKILMKHFHSRIKDAFNFALDNRVLLLKASNNVSVDIALASFPFEIEMIKKRSFFLYQPNCHLMTCSAEDLIILKAFANRSKDWSDIESVIDKQGKKLDTKYINKLLLPLCELKEEPEIMDRLNNLFD